MNLNILTKKIFQNCHKISNPVEYENRRNKYKIRFIPHRRLLGDITETNQLILVINQHNAQILVL